MNQVDSGGAFEQWAILELMGHVRLAGRVSEEELFGTKMGRIDIPSGDNFTTQYFGGGSVYRLTPTTEEIARGVAANNQPRPVQPWEFLWLPVATTQSDDDRAADVAEFLERYTTGALALDSDVLDRLDAAIEQAAATRFDNFEGDDGDRDGFHL